MSLQGARTVQWLAASRMGSARSTGSIAEGSRRSLSWTTNQRIQGDYDGTPARAHRSPNGATPSRAGHADVDPMSGEARNSSTAAQQTNQRRGAQGLADLAQGINRKSAAQGMRKLPVLMSEMPKTTPGVYMEARESDVPVTYQEKSEYPPLAPSGYSHSHLPMRVDPILNALTNNLMDDGKKATAARHITDMMQHMASAMHADPLPAIHEAVRLASPLVRMQSRKQGGKSVQTPILLYPQQQQRRGIMAIIEMSAKRSDRTLSMRLAKEMMAILEGNSPVLTKKEEVHKLAAVNRSNMSVRV